MVVVMRLGLASGTRLARGHRLRVRVAAGLAGLQLREQRLQIVCHLLFGTGAGRCPGCACSSSGGGGAALCLDQHRLDIRGQLLERVGEPHSRCA